MSIAPKCTCGMSPSSFCLSGVKECKQFPEEMEKEYPIGGYAPGNYECKCCIPAAVTRETIEDVLLKTGKFTTCECSEIADVILKDLPAQQGPVWVKGQYDRLYNQLKAEPEREIVCWVDYQWRVRNEPKEILRDICAIMGKVMGFNARGIGYGGAEIWVGEETEKIEFLSECERLHVQ